MKSVYAIAFLPLLAACEVDRHTTVTRIVSTVTPEQIDACMSAAAEARGVPVSRVSAPVAAASTTGPVVTMNVAGVQATCKLDEAGNVETVTFAG